MKLANRFEVLKILEQSGNGTTYRAIDHHQPGRPQCVVSELTYTHPKILERFRQEASILKKISAHARIPKLLAYFHQDNKFYIAQALIEGHDLSQEIKVGKPLDESYVTKLLRDVLSVLACVHQHQTVHRNIQPTSLVRQASSGDIFLTDFGRIKEFSNGQIHSGRMTNAGAAGYRAPEQGRGRVGYASDLYAVGMIAIAALSETHPRTLAIHPLTHRVQWSNENISPALATYIKRLIEPNPKHRYRTAGEALKAFDKTITGIRVGQDSRLPTHVAAKKARHAVETTRSKKPVALIPPKLILKVMGSITAILLVLGTGVKGYQWAAYTISRRWDTVTAPKGYDQAQPDVLVSLVDDGSIRARPETVDAFWTMVAAAKNEGVELLPLAGYISLSEQRQQLSQRTDVDISQWLQQSDYHSGYAVAIGDKNADESTDWDINFETTDAYRWLRRYAKNYGFALSYPQGNPAGEREPWHWRYGDN